MVQMRAGSITVVWIVPNVTGWWNYDRKVEIIISTFFIKSVLSTLPLAAYKHRVCRTIDSDVLQSGEILLSENAMITKLDPTKLESRLLELKGKSQPVKVFVLNEKSIPV